MPVRFRCKHCQQLLGIARRKIGTEVRCPECRKVVLVPADDAPELDDLTRKRDSPVEGGQIGLNLKPPVAEAAVDGAEEQAAPVFLPPAPAPFDVDVYRVPDPVPRAGMNLSPLLAVLLTIGAVLILALAFTVGLLVGRYVL
jgi:phage FluMu protein Com